MRWTAQQNCPTLGYELSISRTISAKIRWAATPAPPSPHLVHAVNLWFSLYAYCIISHKYMAKILVPPLPPVQFFRELFIFSMVVLHSIALLYSACKQYYMYNNEIVNGGYM